MERTLSLVTSMLQFSTPSPRTPKPFMQAEPQTIYSHLSLSLIISKRRTQVEYDLIFVAAAFTFGRPPIIVILNLLTSSAYRNGASVLLLQSVHWLYDNKSCQTHVLEPTSRVEVKHLFQS
jgi:hypothetical protein